MHSAQRNHSLDALRLLAAFCVVGLHVGSIETLSNAWNIARLEMRWAVPFFFILTGLHLGSDPAPISQKIAALVPRLVRVLLLASLLFLPVLIISKGFGGALQQVFSFDFLRSGTYFHLWFISAFIVGLLILQTAVVSGATRVLAHLSALLLLGALLSGSYSPLLPAGFALDGNFAFFRHLLALPCLYAGILLTRNKPMPDSVALSLIVTGAALQVAEALILQMYADVSLFDHQFLIGTLPMTMGVVALARNHAAAASGRLAQWGRDYSLGIYIVHPLWMLFFSKSLAALGVMPDAMGALPFASLVFGASLASMMIYERAKQVAGRSLALRRSANGGQHAVRFWLPR